MLIQLRTSDSRVVQRARICAVLPQHFCQPREYCYAVLEAKGLYMEESAPVLLDFSSIVSAMEFMVLKG
jgi:hypothetical protein